MPNSRTFFFLSLSLSLFRLLCWFTHLASQTVLLVQYVPAGLCFNLNLCCGACRPITVIALSRRVGTGLLSFSTQITDGISSRSWIYVCDSSLPCAILCRQRLYHGANPSFKDSYPASVNYIQKLLCAAITPVPEMESSRIGAMWKNVYRPGHILYSECISATCSLSTICRCPPREFYSQLRFWICLRYFLSWKYLSVKHCLVGASLNKILRTDFCISKSLSVSESDFKKWNSVFR